MSSSPRHRVLFFEGNSDGTVGGSYHSLYYLVGALDRTRYEPILVFRSDLPFLERFRALGVEVHIRPRGDAWRPPARFARSGVLARAIGAGCTVLNVFRLIVLSGLRYAAFFRRERIDLVHLNNSVTRNHDAVLGAWLTRTPMMTHERGINTEYSWLARVAARRMEAIVCISEAVQAGVLACRAASPDKLLVIHNGLEATQLQARRSPEEIRREWDITADQPIVVMVGNIRWWKGQEVLVRALPQVIARHPDVVCVFVGDVAAPDREYHESLQALIDQLGVRRAVRFIGYQTNVADFVNAADAAILASVKPEPFGRVILEAMAMRKPVIGSCAGAVPEIVIEEETGLMFEPGSAAALAGCLVRLLDDPGLARAMGARGYERLITCFDLRRNTRRTEAIYERILTSPGSRRPLSSVTSAR